MIMDHSYEFGNQMSNFDSSEASNRNPHSIPSGTITGHDSGIITGEWKQRFQGNHNGVNLREWIDNRNRVVDAFECLHIFIQIVEVVNLAHSKGIVVHNIRPSCFIISSLNRVSFIESVACSDSDSDVKGSCSFSAQNPVNVSRTVSDLQSGLENLEEERNQRFRPFPMKQMESNWYTSPEEASGGQSSCASDVYRLGALLFELYCTCSSVEEKNATMSSLRHRVFPPQLLLKWPKEALFCLWLLHPEPDSRPKIDEVLQSEFLNGLKDNLDERVAEIELKERIEEQELLLEFLSMMQKRKQEAANSMRSTVSVLTSDLQEVVKLQSSINIKLESNLNHRSINDDDPANPESRKRIRTITHEDEYQTSENRGNLISKTPRLMRNLRKLESAYFLTRRRAIKQEIKPISIDCKESIVSANDFSSRDRIVGRQNRWMNSFLDGLCKYLSFSKLKVKADKQADLLSFSNLVCSLSFDRDGDFFATAGVNKKIKVFEYDSILNGNRDINYPVAEMGSNSKLSSICWNRYIKGQIASSNFEGVVQVWDVTRNQVFTEMREHESRAWSVDFSSADPTLLASGSDDGSIKLWNINQGVSVGTIKTKANVCCVQFPPDSGNSLAFGSADHRMYYYDLRNTSRPLCTFVGHDKTVSYVKFIDSGTLVSSSTDNTLKLWDLSECSSHVVDSPLQSFTGHVNVKNFVGLSVSEGYIATGSETNEVFIYHKAFPMHAFSYKFNTIDPISGDEVDDNEQFVSSVCWRNQSSVLVAANSMGDIKLLEMI
ncbi:hypothetical protein Lser_V15G45335 [Lactuca serriola]